jgi:hypothetical protein
MTTVKNVPTRKSATDKATEGKRAQLNLKVQPDVIEAIDKVLEATPLKGGRSEFCLRAVTYFLDHPELLEGDPESVTPIDKFSLILEKLEALESKLTAESSPVDNSVDTPVGKSVDKLVDIPIDILVDNSVDSKPIDIPVDNLGGNSVDNSVDIPVDLNPVDIPVDNFNGNVALPCSNVTPTNGNEPIQSSPSPTTETPEAIGNESEVEVKEVESAVEETEGAIELKSGEVPYGPEGFTQRELTDYLEGIGKNDVSRYHKNPEKFAKWSASKGPLYRPWEWNKLSQRKARYFLKDI